MKLLQEGEDQLRMAGVVPADIDARLLLCHCLKMTRTQLFLNARNQVSPNIAAQFRKLIKRRVSREPVAYIVEEREFWSLPFYVNGDVLIPRPETEFLLEILFRKVAESKSSVDCCLDLCCGSGVIAIVLALKLHTSVTALDYSEKALEVTRINCDRHDVTALVKPILSDLFSALKPGLHFSIIVSNPPYVRRSEIREDLEPEVADFEPHLALDGGEDGLNVIQRIAQEVLCYLAPAGMFFMEFGWDQGQEIEKLFSRARWQNRFFEEVRVYRDYSGKDRVLYAKMNSYKK